MTEFEPLRDRIVEQLHFHLAHSDAPRALQEAMAYSVLNGGKRIRAMLVYLSAEAMGMDLSAADTAAAAVELVHAYSLVHDDLPAMDNDDFRRGKPSCHIAFDEATAILAGDALQALGFQVLAEDSSLAAEVRMQMVSELARAIGGTGMVAGQVLDLAGETSRFDEPALEQMHHLKTGALISLSVKFGGMVANASEKDLRILADFGATLGLAFQVQDDILDAIGDEKHIGKPVGSDAANQKSTFVTELGLDTARQRLKQLLVGANDTIAQIGPGAGSLQRLAEFVATRNH
jgi:geranylgeranyl diphosphate synthase, type II